MNIFLPTCLLCPTCFSQVGKKIPTYTFNTPYTRGFDKFFMKGACSFYAFYSTKLAYKDLDFIKLNPINEIITKEVCVGGLI